MKKILLAALLLAIPLFCFAQDITTQATPKEIDVDIVDLCKEKGQVRCDRDCVDGFGEECYFDSVKYKKEELKSGFSLPEETKNACFAVHSHSICGNCYNTFELKKNDKFEQVSCEEFYQAIKEKNKSCNDCLDIVYAGCC
jgi:hypothetical protein